MMQMEGRNNVTWYRWTYVISEHAAFSDWPCMIHWQWCSWFNNRLLWNGLADTLPLWTIVFAHCVVLTGSWQCLSASLEWEKRLSLSRSAWPWSFPHKQPWIGKSFICVACACAYSYPHTLLEVMRCLNWHGVVVLVVAFDACFSHALFVIWQLLSLERSNPSLYCSWL